MAAGCGGQDIKDPYGINLRSDPSPWCGARAAGPQWWSRRLPPAGSLKRSMALTTRVCLALSGGPQQLGHSTDHSDARLPDTIGNHPQHRCGPSDERLCSTGPGIPATHPETAQARELFPTDCAGGA
eukprot:CAMPEP_0174351174 /NCGR_PEP_ID=MMETSP0811_2-20130205/8448_1 /TAXON_ID=73025 ORGANISM="Eutreptiella gymnastica-like, Strain CCMP1594" /NCGR_SAMPLE_ID=MMETSP0811_2 /ASSEMBLY_ACC=CAM_ASM_000667 /LENGTH=126 /DNA_ID=CAMNT_0015480143 /DNA_START=49 /DNA_END=429 /DNA_ORIENTATION=-